MPNGLTRAVRSDGADPIATKSDRSDRASPNDLQASAGLRLADEKTGTPFLPHDDASDARHPMYQHIDACALVNVSPTRRPMPTRSEPVSTPGCRVKLLPGSPRRAHRDASVLLSNDQVINRYIKAISIDSYPLHRRRRRRYGRGEAPQGNSSWIPTATVLTPPARSPGRAPERSFGDGRSDDRS